jgi:hypothetical protein
MKNLIYTALAALLFSSCTEEIDFDLNTSKTRLVVEGSITNGTAKHLVKLTTTTSYFENEAAPVVTGAVVSISNGDSTWQLVEEKPGYYYTPKITPAPGKTYTLDIQYDGENYSAAEYMNPPVAADSIEVLLENDFFFEKGKDTLMYNIYLFAQEPAGLGDHYMWKYWAKKPDTAWKDMTPTYEKWIYADDEFIDGNSPDQGWQLFGQIPPSEFKPQTIIRMEMYKISKEYYDFLIAIGEQTQRSGFFDGPPANIPSNIDNGALGYFYVAGVDTSYTVVTQ